MQLIEHEQQFYFLLCPYNSHDTSEHISQSERSETQQATWMKPFPGFFWPLEFFFERSKVHNYKIHKIKICYESCFCSQGSCQPVHRHWFLHCNLWEKCFLSHAGFLAAETWVATATKNFFLGVYYPALIIHPWLVITSGERTAHVEQRVGSVSAVGRRSQVRVGRLQLLSLSAPSCEPHC